MGQAILLMVSVILPINIDPVSLIKISPTEMGRIDALGFNNNVSSIAVINLDIAVGNLLPAICLTMNRTVSFIGGFKPISCFKMEADQPEIPPAVLPSCLTPFSRSSADIISGAPLGHRCSRGLRICRIGRVFLGRGIHGSTSGRALGGRPLSGPVIWVANHP